MIYVSFWQALLGFACLGIYSIVLILIVGHIRQSIQTGRPVLKYVLPEWPRSEQAAKPAPDDETDPAAMGVVEAIREQLEKAGKKFDFGASGEPEMPEE